MKRFLNSILKKYEESDWLLKRKAKTLLILNLLITFIIVAEVFVSSVILDKLVPEFYSNSAIVIVLLLAVFLLKKGSYEWASGLSLLAVTGGISWTRFSLTGQISSDFSYDITQYVVDLVLVLFFGNLIAKTRLVFGLVFLLVIGLLGYYTYSLQKFDYVSINSNATSVILSGFAFILIGGIIGWLNFQQTETAIETAKKDEQRYHNLFDNAQDAIFMISGDCFVECNPRTLQMFGCSRDEIIGRTPYFFAPKRQYDGMESERKAHRLIDLAMAGTPQRFEWQHNRLDGSSFDADVSLNKLELTDGAVLLAVVRDISEKKRLEKEVYISYIKGEESERTRIAKDLHDGLGPLLSACKIYHYNLGEKHVENDCESYNKLGMLLNESMVSIKEISNNLSPHILRNFGLIEAIKSFAGNIRTETRIDITCSCHPGKRYDELIETTLYRVLTELTNNSLKHSGAKEISIAIEEINNVLQVSYTDNGKGFDFNEGIKKSGGFGLLNIQSRILSIGGEIGFKTEKGKGVDVNITINL